MKSEQVTQGCTSPDLENHQGKNCTKDESLGPLLGWCPDEKVSPLEFEFLWFQPLPVAPPW